MKLTLPHPFVLLLGAVAAAMVLTWVVPAGAYQRQTDAATSRELIVPGTYARVDPSPVGPMGAVLAVPRGIVAGADVVVAVLVVGGAFALLDATGALARLVGALVGLTRRRRTIVVLVCLVFATLGALENMHEEIIALIPVLIILSRGLGFGAITALAMSVGSAVVGSAFGPTNPFQAGIAQRLVELPAFTHPALRVGLFAAAVTVWIAWTLFMIPRDDVRSTGPAAEGRATARDGVMLAMLLVPFVPYVVGVLRYGWGFNQLSGLFLVAGFAVGVVAGRGVSGTAIGFLKGMEGMLAAALFVGIARGIGIALTEGQVLDTILHALASPVALVPGIAAAALMVPMHGVLHLPVPSVTGQAVLTMPIMAPLSDLMGFSREAAVIAYQTGAGLMHMITPTNGALLAMVLGAGVSYERWLKFAIPGALLVALVGLAGIFLTR